MNLMYLVSVLAVAGCCSAVKPVQEDERPVVTTSLPSTTQLEHPLLTFEVVEIPRAGIAGDLSGEVETLEKQDGWVPLSNGVRLLDGTKLRIGAGAKLTIRFSPTERIEFRRVEKERWVVLDAQSQGQQ